MTLKDQLTHNLLEDLDIGCVWRVDGPLDHELVNDEFERLTQLTRAAAAEIRRLLRGDFTEEEFQVIEAQLQLIGPPASST